MIEIKHRLTGAVLYRSESATTLRGAVIEAAKAGADLADANLAGAYLTGAYLTDANLADANLADATLAGADLAGANLARANLADANLADANLADATLAGADLAGARNVPPIGVAPDPAARAASRAERMQRFRELHPGVPVVERIDSKILAIVEAGDGKLNMRDWHTCETTHCRAGWAVHLAGEAGYALERQHGPQHAGWMIYRASKGWAPHFYAPTDRALEDIRREAALEQGRADG